MSILSFEEPYTDNEVVGYYEDKLIVKREDGELFFCEIPENLIFSKRFNKYFRIAV